MEITITEALAEVPTLVKRINKKQKTVIDFLARPSGLRDHRRVRDALGALAAPACAPSLAPVRRCAAA